MEIDLTKQTGRVEVTILRPNGELDSQTYQQLIDRAKEVHVSGARHLLLDMSDLTYVSSAGLVALHTIALLLNGEELPDTDNGWASIRSAKNSSQGKLHERLKLLNPRSEIRSVLEMVGFDRAFEIHSNLEDAVKSF